MEETGPLEAGLLTAHPEHRGDSYNQHHQVLYEEQHQVGVTGLLHLEQTEEGGVSAVTPPPPVPSQVFPAVHVRLVTLSAQRFVKHLIQFMVLLK